MKRLIGLILISAVFILSFTPDTADARRRYRQHSSIYNKYYHRNSAISGLRSPYVRTRRPLNVPVTRRSYRPTGRIIYMGPTPTVFYNPWSPMIQPMYQPVFQPSYQPVYNPYPYTNIRVIGPTQPTIIERERIIVERTPAQTQTAPLSPVIQNQTNSISSSINSATDASEQLSIAQQLFKDRKYSEAAKVFNSASGLKPGDPTVKMGQSFSLLAVGDYQGSGASLRSALSLNPAWYTEALDPMQYYGDNKDFNAHLITIERFVEKNPNHIEARLTLGYLYFITGEINQAAEELADILENNPNDLEAISLLGNIATLMKQ